MLPKLTLESSLSSTSGRYNMPEGIVLAKGNSRSGKPTITVDGQLYYGGKNTDISSVGVGDKISFESNSSVFKDTTYWYLNSCNVLVPLQKMPRVGSAHLAPPAAPTPSNAPTKGLTEGERLTVSNW